MVGREEQSWAGCLSLCEKSQRHLSLPSPLPGLDEGYSAQLGTARGLRWLEAERGPFGRVMQTHPLCRCQHQGQLPPLPAPARSALPATRPGRSLARGLRGSVCARARMCRVCVRVTTCDVSACVPVCVVFSCAHRHTMCVGTTHDWWVCVCVLATCRKVRWPGEGELGSRPHHVSRIRVTSKGPVLG